MILGKNEHSRISRVTRNLDKVIAISVLGNLISLAAAPITMIAITRIFTPEMQGYYFTFTSLVSIQIFFELGFGQILVQMVSREWTLFLNKVTTRSESEQHLTRLQSLCSISQKWYGLSAVAVFPFLVFLGLYLFQFSSKTVAWFWPWISACLFVSLNFVMLPFFYVLQGLSRVKEYWLYRLSQKVLASTATIVAIVLACGLWTHTVSFLCLFMLSLCAVYVQRDVALHFVSNSKPIDLGWRKNIFPRQWRAATQWLVLTFAMNVLAPIAFLELGAIESGRLGVAAGLCTAVFGLAVNPILVQAPRLSALAASAQHVQLNRVFARSLVVSLTLCVSSGVLIVLSICLVPQIDFEWAKRFPDVATVTMLMLASCVNVIVAATFVYFRCFNLEPFASESVGFLFLVILISNPAGSKFGSMGIVVVFVSLVWAYGAYIWLRYAHLRRRVCSLRDI